VHGRNPYFVYTSATQMADVEVDTRTGEVTDTEHPDPGHDQQRDRRPALRTARRFGIRMEGDSGSFRKVTDGEN
jgi:hypothetical protein